MIALVGLEMAFTGRNAGVQIPRLIVSYSTAGMATFFYAQVFRREAL